MYVYPSPLYPLRKINLNKKRRERSGSQHIKQKIYVRKINREIFVLDREPVPFREKKRKKCMEKQRRRRGDFSTPRTRSPYIRKKK